MSDKKTPGAACVTCKHYSCVCTIKSRHKANCSFRVSATGTVPIECEHGRDVCGVCDACTCGAGITAEDLGSDVLLERLTRAV